MRIRTAFFLSTVALLLSGCGGGSSGGGNHNPPPATPTVTATAPSNGATGVSASSPGITATFSEAMTASTITSATFTLSSGGSSVTGAVSYSSSNNQAAFTPAAALASNTSYTATITTGAESSAGVALAANYTWSFTTAAPPTPVTVDFSSASQTIRGFGGATAWLGQLTTQQAAALFSPTSGLGLSILRVRIDPTGEAANNWVPANGAWGTELANATEAVAANPNAIVFASPWTPPVSMKNSSASQPYYSPACSPQQNCGGFLDPSNYAAYAAYLEDFVSYFQTNGVNLYGISMQNEPDYANVDYESCNWTPQQMDSWIASNASVLSTKLIMPESFDFDPVQAATALSDPNAEPLVSIVGGHLYGTTPAYQTQAEGLGKDVWMTEHYVQPAGAQPAIGDAISMAEEIHNSMVTGQFNAYVWWWIWDNPGLSINIGLIDENTSAPSPTYYGYAIEQFSRFVQPGWVRVSATANPETGIDVSAYSGSGHVAIVVINASAGSVNQPFTLQNTTVTSLTPYQTTANGGFQQQTAVSVSGGQFSYTLPAQSITTFYQ